MYSTSAEQLRNILDLHLEALQFMMSVIKQFHDFQLFYIKKIERYNCKKKKTFSFPCVKIGHN